MKRTALALCLLIVLLALIMSISQFNVVLADAGSSIPKPSVPEFTLRFVDNSYDVPPTYGVDPYTGKTVVTQDGYHVQNKSIEVTITNQQFTSYHNENGSLVGLFYNIRVKGHFKDWIGEPDAENYVYRSDSHYTVIAYSLGGNNDSSVISRRLDENFVSGEVDFQVQALIGYYTKVIHPPSPGDVLSGGQPGYHYVFTGEASDWSNTQTLAISESQESSTSILDTVVRAVVLLVIALVAVGVLVYCKKRKHGGESS